MNEDTSIKTRNHVMHNVVKPGQSVAYKDNLYFFCSDKENGNWRTGLYRFDCEANDISVLSFIGIDLTNDIDSYYYYDKPILVDNILISLGNSSFGSTTICCHTLSGKLMKKETFKDTILSKPNVINGKLACIADKQDESMIWLITVTSMEVVCIYTSPAGTRIIRLSSSGELIFFAEGSMGNPPPIPPLRAKLIDIGGLTI